MKSNDRNKYFFTLILKFSYIESLSEPSPYDSFISSTTTDVVPDLLMFSKPLLDLSSTPVITVGHINTICTDSGPAVPPTSHREESREISNEVLRTMTEAMGNLTTICTSEEARNSVRESMTDTMTNDEGNK